MGEGGQGMVIRFIVQPLTDVTVVEKMIHDPDGIESQLLRQGAEGKNLLSIFNAPVIGYGHTNFHFRHSLSPLASQLALIDLISSAVSMAARAAVLPRLPDFPPERLIA